MVCARSECLFGCSGEERRLAHHGEQGWLGRRRRSRARIHIPTTRADHRTHQAAPQSLCLPRRLDRARRITTAEASPDASAARTPFTGVAVDVGSVRVPTTAVDACSSATTVGMGHVYVSAPASAVLCTAGSGDGCSAYAGSDGVWASSGSRVPSWYEMALSVPDVHAACGLRL